MGGGKKRERGKSGRPQRRPSPSEFRHNQVTASVALDVVNPPTDRVKRSRQTSRSEHASRVLSSQSLYEQKVWVIPKFFTSAECRTWISFSEQTGFIETFHPASHEVAYRNNGRIEFFDNEIAQNIWTRIQPFVPSCIDGMSPVGCFDKIRIYRYRGGEQRFGKHVDESCESMDGKSQTAITVLIYLSGSDTGLVGGETVFYKDDEGEIEATRCTPTSGLLLFHGYV